MGLLALTLTQPWATLIAVGAKKIETRSWFSSHRAELAIHAAKSFPRDAQALCYREPFRSVLETAGSLQPHHVWPNWRELVLPLGAVVAVGRIETIGVIELQGQQFRLRCVGRNVPVDGVELELGDYSPGRYGWVFTQVRRLPEPIPCRGAQGLWTVPDEVEVEIGRRLAWKS